MKDKEFEVERIKLRINKLQKNLTFIEYLDRETKNRLIRELQDAKDELKKIDYEAYLAQENKITDKNEDKMAEKKRILCVGFIEYVLEEILNEYSWNRKENKVLEAKKLIRRVTDFAEHYFEDTSEKKIKNKRYVSCLCVCTSLEKYMKINRGGIERIEDLDKQLVGWISGSIIEYKRLKDERKEICEKRTSLRKEKLDHDVYIPWVDSEHNLEGINYRIDNLPESIYDKIIDIEQEIREIVNTNPTFTPETVPLPEIEDDPVGF